MSALSERAMPNIYLPFTVTSWVTLYVVEEGAEKEGDDWSKGFGEGKNKPNSRGISSPYVKRKLC